MSIRTKGRRRIAVGGETYVWYAAPDDDSPYHILHIVSDDKALILSCPLGTGTDYVISKGRVFQNQPANGRWNRYLLPFAVPEAVTPEFVARLIVWAAQERDAVPVSGMDVPV